MICFTGDTHGDFSRFMINSFPKQVSMTKNDYVIICGDFGGVWNNDEQENKVLDWLESKTFTTLFVDGNHENFDLLNSYPLEEWNGGLVHKIRPSVIHLTRGQVYNFHEKTVFTMGGAKSHDIKDGILENDDPDLKEKIKKLEERNALYRVNHMSWWKEEMPSEQEYQLARKNLEKANWKVDMIISHCAPTSVIENKFRGFYDSDELTDFFDEIKSKCEFKFWFFGHYHDIGMIDDKYVLLYDEIL